MIAEEFSNMFDTLLNSYNLQTSFGEQGNGFEITLDEYEKSIFLTKAQEELAIDIYSGRNTIYNKAFEQTEEIRRYLNNLVKTAETSIKVIGKTGLTANSVFFQLPNDTWFITYESVTLTDTALGCLNNTEAIVVPLPQDELYRAKDNPYRGPSENRVLRLDIEGNISEIISKYNVSKYKVRYISKPTPIILIDLPNDLSINGLSTKSECTLNPVVHRAILDRAVELAVISKTQLTGKK